jgi:hypothetical protein
MTTVRISYPASYYDTSFCIHSWEVTWTLHHTVKLAFVALGRQFAFITAIYETGLTSHALAVYKCGYIPFWRKISCFWNRHAFKLFYDSCIWHLGGHMCSIFAIRLYGAETSISCSEAALWYNEFAHVYFSTLPCPSWNIYVWVSCFILYSRSSNLIYKNTFHICI